MIKLENLNKYFNHHRKNEIHVIDNTSLDLGNNGLVAFLGPSGSGKTTLLNVIGGLDNFNGGDFYINDIKITKRNYYKMDKIRNLNIGYIFQDYKLLDNLTVYENVSLVLKMLGLKEDEIKKRVDYVLETVGIYRYRNRLCSMLSGGERQRVGIARALVKNPSIILADEPTGNLDSKNSIEIMNIIKAISKDRLVILVTHEKELAKFYASRVIEVSDGKIVNDYQNEHNDDLDYRIDNKIYLKDFKNHTKISKENVSFNVYSDLDSKLDFDIVFRNGNIYIKSNTNEKIEIINESNMEFVDDHYKKIDKKIYENYQFKIDDVCTTKDYKYKSIYNPINMITKGFKKIRSFNLVKKLLLLGFFATGIVIMYSVSSISAALKIDDSKFLKINKDYLVTDDFSMDISLYKKLESIEDIEYILPKKSLISLDLVFDDYYQTSDNLGTTSLSGSLTSLNLIGEKDLVYGNMPTNNDEIVIDMMVYNTLGINKLFVGVQNPSDIIGRKVSNSISTFKIVGLTDIGSPNIYTFDDNFINMLYNKSENSYYYSLETYVDYNLLKDKITVKKGRLPINDYEVMLDYNTYNYLELGKEIDETINGHKLVLVGYYSTIEQGSYYLVNNKMIKYKLVEDSINVAVYTKNKEKVIDEFKNLNIELYDSYDNDLKIYKAMIQLEVSIKVAFALVMIVISFIEIYLMMRSSFLSRIKEIGILRAIGVKKMDIIRMFSGEIVAITTISGFVGVIVMTYIISMLVKVSYFKASFVLNPLVFITATVLVYLCNILFGLVPVVAVIKDTPASILSRHDID